MKLQASIQRRGGAGVPAQKGFSLVELLVVVTILVIVFSIVVVGTIQLLARNNSDNAKLDVTQQSREFLDQIVRDLHQAGYPSLVMYGSSILISPAVNDHRAAVGLVSVSANQLQFEGDLDGSGNVQSVTVQLSATGPGGTCPCTLKRGTINKVDGSPFQQPTGAQGLPNFFTELNNVINSNGVYTISGTTASGVTNDVAYASCKIAPVFAAFDKTGSAVALPIDVNSGGPPTIKDVNTIKVSVNILSQTLDMQDKTAPFISMTASARVND